MRRASGSRRPPFAPSPVGLRSGPCRYFVPAPELLPPPGVVSVDDPDPVEPDVDDPEVSDFDPELPDVPVPPVVPVDGVVLFFVPGDRTSRRFTCRTSPLPE